MKLNKLKAIQGNKGKKARRGRGIGSGSGGHTTGTGMKGQNSRAGSSKPFAFEGGQVPLYKRIPKIGGFNNPTTKDIVAVVITKLNRFDTNSIVTPNDLVKAKILKKLPKHGVKLLNTGKLAKSLTIKGFLASKGAKEAVISAGGTFEE